jgi:hypothetical protein
MSNAITLQVSRPSPASSLTATAVLATWFLTVFWLAAKGAFVGPSGAPPFALMAGFAGPLAVFFVLLKLSRAFRDFVFAIDLQLIAGLNAWRLGGFAFLALYAHGILPGAFALPAGLGDMAVGVVAPWLVLHLIRDPAFGASRRFRTWNWLGILDLIVAVSLGGSLAFLAHTDVTTAPMAQLPLVFIPAYLVPIYIMLHVSALFRPRPASLERA